MYYYGNEDNPYKNGELNRYLKKNLPMEEFVSGNFSQGHKIIDAYRGYLTMCLSEATKKYTGDDGDIQPHLKKELEKLEKTQKELSEEKNRIVTIIKQREAIFQELKKECAGDKVRDTIRKKFEYYKFEKSQLENFFDELEKGNNEQYIAAKDTYIDFKKSPHYKNIGRDIIGMKAILEEKEIQKNNKVWQTLYSRLENFDFDKEEFEKEVARLEQNNFDNYKTGETTYKEMISSEYYKNLKKEVWRQWMRRLVSDRNDITAKLSNKKNSSNIEQQIANIKTGKERNEIEKYIREEVEKIVRIKSRIGGDIIYPKGKESLFMSVITTQLISNPDVSRKLRKQAIHLHPNKEGLFHHIWTIYTEYPQSMDTIINHRDDKECNINIKEESIVRLTQEAKRILDTIPHISLFWIIKISREENDLSQKMGTEKRKAYQIDILVSHLGKILREKKNCNWAGLNDSNLTKLIQGINEMTESLEFEHLCEKVREVDFNREREILMVNGKNILEEIFASMTEEERKDVNNHYQGWKNFEQIKETVSKKENIQLLLFDLPAPIEKEVQVYEKKRRKSKKVA
ncbi:MAG: hypothetical protein NTY80_00680 [candidate division SR1 bacterium]|nr:hypothetical protein [candidate division SR1 bacterium]